MISIAETKRFARLHRKKHREAEKIFLAEGESVISEAPSPPLKTFSDPETVRKLSTLATPAGPVAAFPFLDRRLEDLLSTAERVLLLHGVQDPGNVGTAIRAAHAFGAGVALSKGCADLYNPKTVRGTMGSIFHVPIAREIETVELLDEAREHDFTPVAAVPEGGVPPRSMSDGKTLILVGAEGGGLPMEVVEACDERVTISSLAASLNAAVAAAILLHEAYSRVLP